MKKNMPTLLEIQQIIHWTYLKCKSNVNVKYKIKKHNSLF